MAFSNKMARMAGEVLRGRLLGGGNGQQSCGPHSTLKHQSTAISELKDLLQRTITRGEGNSLLVIGPKGSGKSWVLEEALLKVGTQAQCRGNFITVRLNGLVHTDDRLGLLEIVKQLDIKEDLGDKITLSFAALLEYLLQALKEGSRSKQSVVIILDNFDLFTFHKNQMLLYNLFDIAQSASTPIAVIGLTCRLDAIELLEKRVKSRFSHRQLTLFNEHTFDEYLQLFTSLLSLSDTFPNQRFKEKWNQHIMGLLDNPRVCEALKKTYNLSRDIGSLISLLTLPVCRLGLRASHLQPSDFIFSLKQAEKDAVSAILCGLSVLELCLVIAMKHLGDVHDEEPFNFEMVYNEYKKFTQRSSSVEFFGKPVALKAFEHLIALELVCPADSGGLLSNSRHGNKVMKEYQPVVLTLGGEQFKEAIQCYPNCPTDVQRWANTTGLV